MSNTRPIGNIWKRKQNLIEKNNKANNAKCNPCTYAIGDEALLRQEETKKYETPYQGPYSTTKQINENDTV